MYMTCSRVVDRVEAYIFNTPPKTHPKSSACCSEEGNAKPRVQTSTVRMPEFNKWTRGFALFGPDPRVREFSQLQGCPPLTPFPEFKLLIPEFEKFELGESHPGGGGRATLQTR